VERDSEDEDDDEEEDDGKSNSSFQRKIKHFFFVFQKIMTKMNMKR
jgi:hypothetical protein